MRKLSERWDVEIILKKDVGLDYMSTVNNKVVRIRNPHIAPEHIFDEIVENAKVICGDE